MFPSFCMTDDAELSEFMSSNPGILRIRNHSPTLKIDLFERFFQELLAARSLDDLASFDPRCLSHELCVKNRVHAKDYALKTKVHALFVAAFTQRRLFFLVRSLGEEPFFTQAETELFSGMTRPDTDEDELESLVKFYIVLREIRFWKTPTSWKWEKFAMCAASIATGEGMWFCPGGGATLRTVRRLGIYGHFFFNKDNDRVMTIPSHNPTPPLSRNVRNNETKKRKLAAANTEENHAPELFAQDKVYDPDAVFWQEVLLLLQEIE